MRDKIIIVSVAVAVIVIGILVFFSGNKKVSTTPASVAESVATTTVPFTKLVQGAKSNVTTRANYVIASADGLSEFWKMAGASGKPPAVDFKTQAVIAVFAGKEPTSSISIAKIEDSSVRMVSIAITKPEGVCAKKASISSPYEIAVVPATLLSLAHEDILTTTTCKP